MCAHGERAATVSNAADGEKRMHLLQEFHGAELGNSIQCTCKSM